MRKVYSLGFLALVALAGCSSWKSPKSEVATVENGMSAQAAREWEVPFEFEPLKRLPSQIVKRPTYHWESDTLKIPVSAGTVINRVYQVKFTQYSEYVSREPVTRLVPREVLDRWEQRNDAVLVCDAQEGAGKSALWNAFYSATAKNKPAALDQAVQGIGVPSAKKLIDANYFHSKPRSWEDFESEIRSAERAGLLEKTAVYQILYKYRQENMRKLGYNTQLTGACRLAVGETYYVPVYVVRNVSQTVLEDVPHKDMISSEVKNYTVRISGQKLQNFEQDTLVFSFDRDSNNVSLAPAYFNNYSLSLVGGALVVNGTGRKAVHLPSDVILPGAVVEASGGMARFSAAFNQKYVPKTPADGQLLVSIRVHSCRQGLIKSLCALRRDEQIQPVEVKRVGAGVVTHQFQRASGRLYWVSYWVNTSNSPWYARNVVKSSREPSI